MRAARQRITQTDWSRPVAENMDSWGDLEWNQFTLYLPTDTPGDHHPTVDLQIPRSTIALSPQHPRVLRVDRSPILWLPEEPLTYVSQPMGEYHCLTVSLAVPRNGDADIKSLLRLLPAADQPKVRQFFRKTGGQRYRMFSTSNYQQLMANITGSLRDPSVLIVEST